MHDLTPIRSGLFAAALCAAVCGGLAGCDNSPATPSSPASPSTSSTPAKPTKTADQPKPVAENGTLEDFRAWAAAFVADPNAAGASVLLEKPEAWFAEHFPSDLAAKLAADYTSNAARNGGQAGLANFVAENKRRGRTEVKYSEHAKIGDGIDPAATGLQNAALLRATKPLRLYTIRMIEPGKDSGSALSSFVKTPGGYRFIGKVAPLNPTRGDLVADMLCNLPLGDAEKLAKEQGLLKTGAAEYLKERGVLP